MDGLARWRDEFPILSRTVYMISNSLAAELVTIVSRKDYAAGGPPFVVA